MTRFPLSLVLGVFLLGVGISNAVQVDDLGISPGQNVSVSITGFYSGGVAAGINKLVVDGTAMDGFCIDPFHFSLSSSSGYQFLSLDNAPKSPGTMNSTQAEEISKLWAMVYSPSMTANNAAGMQVAIWEIVGGSNFSISGIDYGAATMLSNLTSFAGAGANLIALSGPGQDYVVCNPHGDEEHTPSIPDGGSALLLMAISATTLAIGQRLRSALG